MPVSGIWQPELIQIDDELRLRRYDGAFDRALSWYHDRETVLLVDGKEDPYTPDSIKRMYDYLGRRGEVYWIEYREEDGFAPIGDVTSWQEDMPIVIGERKYRGRGIGRRVVAALCRRAADLGWREIRVAEIYDFNEGSRRCFESVGFVPEKKSKIGTAYVKRLGE